MDKAEDTGVLVRQMQTTNRAILRKFVQMDLTEDVQQIKPCPLKQLQGDIKLKVHALENNARTTDDTIRETEGKLREIQNMLSSVQRDENGHFHGEIQDTQQSVGGARYTLSKCQISTHDAQKGLNSNLSSSTVIADSDILSRDTIHTGGAILPNTIGIESKIAPDALNIDSDKKHYFDMESDISPGTIHKSSDISPDTINMGSDQYNCPFDMDSDISPDTINIGSDISSGTIHALPVRSPIKVFILKARTMLLNWTKNLVIANRMLAKMMLVTRHYHVTQPTKARNNMILIPERSKRLHANEGIHREPGLLIPLQEHHQWNRKRKEVNAV